MSTVHVCIISGQPLPNLLPLLHERPDKAIFLTSPEMREIAERLVAVVRPRGIQVEINDIASAFDFAVMVDACETILKRLPVDSQLALNVTGGTKIAALAAFQVFFFEQANHRILYVDSAGGHLLELAPANRKTALRKNLVKVRDCLLAYGMQPISLVAPEDIPRRGNLGGLTRLLINDPGLLRRLNSALSREGKRKYANIALNTLGAGADQLADALEQCGVARRTGSGNLNIFSEESLFFCHGGWLEEYVYRCVSDLGAKGLDRAMNVRVSWSGGRTTTENELDVLFTHANTLHLISCKAANPDREGSTGSKATEALNELGALTERIGGLFGKAMLVSAHRIRPADWERAEKMTIELVDQTDVFNLKTRLRTWMKLP